MNPAGAGRPDRPDPVDEAEPDGFPLRLRPFLLTSGRVTGADATVTLETQLVATERGCAAGEFLRFERADIVAACALPLAVAEVAARLRLHVGVVKVLVGDLAAEGYLNVHLPDHGAARDTNTILRVLHGLQAIS